MNISKIANLNMTGNYAVKKISKNQNHSTMPMATNNSQMSQSVANALKAQVSFGAGIKADPKGITTGWVEKAPLIIATLNGENQIDDNLSFKHEGFEINSKSKGDKRNISITQKGKKLADLVIKDGLKNEVKFATAKHKPEITVKAGEYEIKLLEGSRLDKDGKLSIRYYGDYKTLVDGEEQIKTSNKPLSFTGTYASVLCKKESVFKATNDAKETPLTALGAYAQEMKEDDPSIVVLEGGFGTRFANMTDKSTCKPAFKMPNGQSIASGAFDLAKNSTGTSDIKRIEYLEQINDDNPEAPFGVEAEGDIRHKMNAYGSDGGAVIKAVLDGNIPKSKNLAILNADTITQLDLSQAYHKLNALPGAALVIPVYPVPEHRAKSFGLMSGGHMADIEGSRELIGFNEKPGDPANDAKEAMIKGLTIDGEQAYSGNPGIYLFSKEVLQNLDIILPKAEEIALTKAQEKARKEGKPIPAELKDPFSSSTFLGNAFVPAVVELCNAGKLRNSDGRPMHTYMVPMKTTTGEQAYWDDIGCAEAFVHTCQEIAYETAKEGDGVDNKFYGIRGLNDFKNSVDLLNGIVYANPKTREGFEAKYAQDFNIEGDVYIS